MSTVLVVYHRMGMGVGSLQEVYNAAILSQNHRGGRGGSDNLLSSSGVSLADVTVMAITL